VTEIYDNGRPRRFRRLLTEQEWQALCEISCPVRYRPGDQIFTEGDDSTFVLVIVDGAVKVRQRRDEAETRPGDLVAIRCVDDVVGEGVWSEDRRNATVTAMRDVRALRIEADDFAAFLNKFRTVDLALRRSSRDRSEESLHKLLDPRNASSQRQLARQVIELIYSVGIRTRKGAHGYAVDIGVTQAELGQLTGFAKRTVERAFAIWRKNGYVSLQDGLVIVHDEEGLWRTARWSRRRSEHDGVDSGPHRKRRV
jgi:CRP/FNR family transcriptional regulator, cyclic AMP receptor protein